MNPLQDLTGPGRGGPRRERRRRTRDGRRRGGARLAELPHGVDFVGLALAVVVEGRRIILVRLGLAVRVRKSLAFNPVVVAESVNAMADGIARRDFLNGAALAIAAGLAPVDQLLAAPPASGTTSATGAVAPYPPALDGMRGTTDEAFKVMHAIVFEGKNFDTAKAPAEETYDLVVVGAGLAGLTAAWSYRERRPNSKVLILDNNDDFGGHARRTEHKVGNRVLLSYGGSESMVAPAAKFTGELGRILKEIGIAPERFEQENVFHRQLYPSLGLSKSTFFDAERMPPTSSRAARATTGASASTRSAPSR